MIVYGPVPSRRLGSSVGINNIPSKKCSYSCVYCQIGNTKEYVIEPDEFYGLEEILTAVQMKLLEAREKCIKVDFLTLVANGEPSLDINLGFLIDRLKKFNIPLALITNSSLLTKSDVRRKLLKVDWISVKVDAVDEQIWKKIDRPYKDLNLHDILDSIVFFRKRFNGRFNTETMLIRDLNDSQEHLDSLADYLTRVKPDIAYLSVPIRPPAQSWVQIPSDNSLCKAFRILKDKNINVELNNCYEGNDFKPINDIESELVAITSVHPMREDAVMEFLKKGNCSYSVVNKLIQANILYVNKYNGTNYYSRKIK